MTSLWRHRSHDHFINTVLEITRVGLFINVWITLIHPMVPEIASMLNLPFPSPLPPCGRGCQKCPSVATYKSRTGVPRNMRFASNDSDLVALSYQCTFLLLSRTAKPRKMKKCHFAIFRKTSLRMRGLKKSKFWIFNVRFGISGSNHHRNRAIP